MLDKQDNSIPLGNLDDAQLVNETQKGNPKAFEILVRRYQNLVYNIVYKMTSNSELSKDCTQETFLKVYRALDKFDKSRSFRPWILKIARNTTLTNLTNKGKESSLSDISPSEEPVTDHDASYAVESLQSQKEFLQALEFLPSNQKEVFILKYQHELSYNEISEITNLSISSIKSLLFRARESLRKKLTRTETGIKPIDDKKSKQNGSFKK